jgi:hypothetical protein
MEPNTSIACKEIQEIFHKTIEETDLDINKINPELLNVVLESTYNPLFTGTLWKLYKFLYEKVTHSDKLFWIPSGNSVGFLKYNGHIPWDDDIDIGFQIDNNDFNTYITFLVNSIKKGFIVNLHMMKDENMVDIDWYNNDEVVNLVLNTENPSWNHIKETDLRELMRTDPSKLHFGNITLKESVWKNICSKFNFQDAYKWTNKYLVTPWIDIIPFIKKDNKFYSHVNDLKKSSPPLSIEFDYFNFHTVPGKWPKDLVDCILYQYNEERSYINFLHWDTIYSHVKKNRIILDYNVEPELHKFVRAFSNKYNEELLSCMDKISYDMLC